jgi:NADH-quinone oxidoreductase subunit F
MPEERVVLKNCGLIDAKRMRSYLDRGGFKSLKKAKAELGQSGVVEEIKTSGLRGRGGAGFPCGLKWEFARKTESDTKFVICNADEGEMGTFKDRYIMENDPFTLVEGIALACYAVGAKQAFIYLREEYHFLQEILRNAVEQSLREGFLDDLTITLFEGAGAYVCGEETALMESIEGKRGEARYRPPFPPIKGLLGKPTVINNVETLMNIPPIILNGSGWFKSIGTEKSHGTKVFSVSGDVERPGVYELVLGSKLKELVVDLAGAKDTQVVQVGGAAGRLIPARMLDTSLSYESVLGSGAVTVFDRKRDLIDVVYRTIQFFADESCGKCVPCREGTQVLMEILGRMVNGEGARGDLKAMEDVSTLMRLSSLCGLGQSAAVPVLDSLEYFGHEYQTRINQSVFLRSLKGIEK